MKTACLNTLFIKQSAILEVLQELGMQNFNELKRKFMGINNRTLRYHLKILRQKGFIKKRGITNGVYYEFVS